MYSPLFQENNVNKDLSSLPIPKGSDKGKQLLIACGAQQEIRDAQGMHVTNQGVPETSARPLMSFSSRSKVQVPELLDALPPLGNPEQRVFCGKIKYKQELK